jgi:hypothetical protein
MRTLRLVWWPWLLSRLWVAGFVYAGHGAHPFLEVIPGGFAGVSNEWLNPWTTFDSGHFLDIAQNGYKPHTVAFYPFFPLVLRAFGPSSNAMALAGIALSNAAFLLALCLLHELTRRDLSPKAARWAVWLLAFWPTSAFFSALYTESAFACWILALFLCIRRGQWRWAALWALGAALTKNSGWLLALAMWAEWFALRRSATASVDKAAPWLPLLPLSAFVGVQSYFTRLFGAGAGLESQAFYGRAWTWPWNPIAWDIADILRGRALELTTMLNVAFTLAALWVLWRARREQPLSYSLLLGGILTMHLALGHNKPPYTIDTVRYLSTTFPFVQRIALWAQRTFSSRLSLAMAALIYALICAVMSYLFGQKSFVG